MVGLMLWKDCSGCWAEEGPGTPGVMLEGSLEAFLLLGLEVVVAWTSQVWRWREAAGSQTCLGVKANGAC